jgi:type IV secretion system protein VirD4
MHPHHMTALLIGLVIVLLIALAVRVIIGNPGSARHRVRLLRWRIRFYLRPGPGYANMLELAVRWSRLRAVRSGGRVRPSLSWRARMLLPVTGYAVRLGRAHLGKRVIGSMEDQTLALAPPRKGKSGWLADRIIDHPGAVVTTTTRIDLFENSAWLRAQHGPVHVFNPEGIGGVPSTFRWNPLDGCEQPAIALQRATSLTSATQTESMQDMAFWIGKASAVLACFLHAAALDQRAMTDVYRWAHGIDANVPEQILATHPGTARSWLGPLREIRRPGRTADSIRMTVTRALAWLADPAVASATSPGPGEGFDVADFVSGSGTLYMIGSGREEAPIAPLFRAFVEYVHADATFVGSLQPHGRLDPPMLMALDEVTQICPVPLPNWMADSAGKGILIVAVCHGMAQLESRWGNAGARSIWDTAGIKLILCGVTDMDTLEDLSRLCGEIALRTPSRTQAEDGRWARTITYQYARVLPPELLRMLPDWWALVLCGNLFPVVIRLRMAWWRHDHRMARRARSAHKLPVQVQTSAQLALPKRRSSESDELSWRSTEQDGWLSDEPIQEPTAGDPVTTPQLLPDEPQATDPRLPQDAPPLPPSPGPGSQPGPRRPWHPPVNSGDRR